MLRAGGRREMLLYNRLQRAGRCGQELATRLLEESNHSSPLLDLGALLGVSSSVTLCTTYDKTDVKNFRSPHATYSAFLCKLKPS